MKDLSMVYNRGFSSGFFLGKPIEEWTDAYGSKAQEKKVFIGIVTNYFSKAKVAQIKVQALDLKRDSRVMVQGPTTGIVEAMIDEIRKESNDKSVASAKKGDLITIPIGKVRKNDKVYIIQKA